MEITFFKNGDLEHIREMTRSSFLLNSFNIDTHLPRPLKGEVYFENMAVKAMKETANSCLVARLKGKAVGYIIHGVDSRLSKMFDLSTATIMLFCVAKDARGKGVGRALLSRSMEMLLEKGVRLITVGTDSNNISALNLYQDAGFRIRMNWGTYRFYPNFALPDTTLTVDISPYAGEKGVEKIVRYTERPIAFFRENAISKRALVRFRNDILDSIVKGIREGRNGTMLVKTDGLLKRRISGLLTYEKEPSIEKFFNNQGEDKPIYRINDIVIDKKHMNKGIGSQLLSHFTGSVTNYHFIETWISMDNWPMINIVTKCGYRLAHQATILHFLAPPA